jgi:hypothetical protein
MPFIGQQHDVGCMTTIGVTSSVPEFLSAREPTDAMRIQTAKLPQD